MIMLKINMEYRKGILFLRLKGNLNESTHKKFEEYAFPVIKDYGIKYLVINLSELVSLDNYGKSSLEKSGLLIDNNDGRVLLINSKNNVNLDYQNITDELVALDLLKV